MHDTRKAGPLFWRATLLVLATTISAPRAHAAVTVSLSSPTNLSQLTVGQTAVIDVTLAGLPSPPNATDFVFNLNTKVLFNSALLTVVPDPTSPSGLTATVAAGSVFDNPVQGPLQITNFNYQGTKPDRLPDSSLAPGAAVGIFSQYPNTTSGAIGLDGVYYSFLVKAAGVGSGLISFDPTPGANEYAANETGFNYAPLPASSSLSFTILPAASAVPEPSPLALLALGLLPAGLLARRRR